MKQTIGVVIGLKVGVSVGDSDCASEFIKLSEDVFGSTPGTPDEVRT